MQPVSFKGTLNWQMNGSILHDDDDDDEDDDDDDLRFVAAFCILSA